MTQFASGISPKVLFSKVLFSVMSNLSNVFSTRQKDAGQRHGAEKVDAEFMGMIKSHFSVCRMTENTINIILTMYGNISLVYFRSTILALV